MHEAQFAMGDELNLLLHEAGIENLQMQQNKQFNVYLSLILRWNARLNLTAVRDVKSILSRHFVESIACARALPANTRTLLDFGSGAGFPGIPIAICRPEIAVTLAESQGKKAAFLHEAIRSLELNVNVLSGRAETMNRRFDCVTLRAVDKMDRAVKSAAHLVDSSGWIALMTTTVDATKLRSAPGTQFHWLELLDLPGSEQRVLLLGQHAEKSFDTK
ncbi:MAG TPA: 16S rRNA (guanine(527)-N(7))-methyltransferase RsmG [Terracidiphilus sp.]|jgi:16S rRNA (guanine527-N7)-methyltransferase|nr:16S rRNA (guanine(527)-N(7))-methyltransferase RsmG [Terracidiphilus sp.]